MKKIIWTTYVYSYTLMCIRVTFGKIVIVSFHMTFSSLLVFYLLSLLYPSWLFIFLILLVVHISFSQSFHQIIYTLLLPPLFLLATFSVLVSVTNAACELNYEGLEIRASDDKKQCTFTSATLNQKIIHIQLDTRLWRWKKYDKLW